MEDFDDEGIEKNEQCGILKIFDCCAPKEESNEIFTDTKESKGISILRKFQKEIDDVFTIVPIEYIRDDEKLHIKFTKEGLLDFISNIKNLEYTNIYNENGLIISTKDSTDISPNTTIYRCQIEKPKNYFSKIPSIKEIGDAIAVPELRKKFDPNIKEYKIIDTINDKTDIVKMVTLKQFSIIAEREFVEKRARFSDEGVYYSFSSSVPDKLFTPKDEPVRATNYMSIIVISEDLNTFYFDSFNQIDIKMGIPQDFIDKNLPIKIKEFFDKLFESLGFS